MVKEKKRKNDHGRGFQRSPKQWENSIATHIGKFVDRMTTSDVLNLIAFAGGSYATYKGIEAAAGIARAIPEWLKWISPLSPFLYQIVIPTEAAKQLDEFDKVVVSLLGGYSIVKLAPVVVQAAVTAAIPTP